MVDQTSAPKELYDWQKEKQPFQFGRVMNRAFAGLFKNIKYIIGAILIVCLISLILSLPTLLADTDNVTSTTAPIFIVASILSLISFIFFLMFIAVFTDHVAFASFTNRRINFKRLFFRSLKLTFPVLFVGILYFLASNIGMLFLIVPGIIMSVGWCIIGPSYLHEDTPLLGSFGRSWQLTRGYKWWVWLATIVMGIIILIIFSISAVTVSALSLGQVTTSDMSVGFSTTSFLGGLLFSFLIYLAIALYASFTTALYTELRELKEGPLAEEMSAVFD